VTLLAAFIELHPVHLRAEDWWTIATAVCCSVACALVGCFLVLRRLSLLGDAISHAILPGVAGAFLLTGTRDPLAMLAGAMAVGVSTSALSAGLHRWGRVPADAAMGVVFTALFALGVILVSLAASSVDLDPGCVLYGVLETTAFDTVTILGFELPRALVWLGSVLLVNAAVIALFFKELTITSFDPALAAALGFPVAAIHYALMTLVAGTCVASFEAVGSVLVVAMLAAPGATAHLLTDRLPQLLAIACLSAAASAFLGYVAALTLETSVAGSIAAVAGAQFLLAVVAAPRHGVLARWVSRARLALRIDREDLLGLLYRWEERARAASPAAPGPTRADLRRATRKAPAAALAFFDLRRRGLVTPGAGGVVRLTDAGRAAAAGVVRSHRLWESYLARHVPLPIDHLHAPSHRAEHFIGPELATRLRDEVGRDTDPHGTPIPGDAAGPRP
jgi:manganese/zinc/iron transport system permease protein